MGRKLRVAWTFALAWLLLNVFRAALPIFLPEIRRLYGVGFTDAGVIFALLFAGVAFMQFPSGVVADLVGDKKVVVGSLVASSILLATFGFARTVPRLMAVAVLFGAAVGGFRSVAISSVTKAVPENRRNGALGLMAAGNPVGNLLGPIVAGFGLLAIGIVQTPLLLGGVGFLCSLLLAVALYRVDIGGSDRVRPSRDRPGPSPSGLVTKRVQLLTDVLTSGPGVLIVLASLAFSTTWQGLFTFLPTYLVEVRQLAIGGSSVITGVTFGVGIVANVGAGRLGDRVGEGSVLVGGFLLGFASFTVLIAGSGIVVTVVALIGIGLGLGAITPARDTFISRLSGPADRGSVVGGVRTVYILLASAGTVIVGFVIDLYGFDGALAALAGALGVGAISAILLLRRTEGTTTLG